MQAATETFNPMNNTSSNASLSDVSLMGFFCSQMTITVTGTLDATVFYKK